MGQFDRSSKWLIQRHGDAMLRLAGVTDIVGWRSVQSEVVQPGQLLDGLLEVTHAGSTTASLYVLEIATYPERRLEEQLLRDLLLVYLHHRVLPEVIALVLHPKGRLRAARGASLASPSAGTKLQAAWRVVELWTIPAETLLATNDPGLVPWVPLTDFEGRPETMLKRCRQAISKAPKEERANLFAVTQVLTSLRYNDPTLLRILGGEGKMIESPLLDETIARGKAEGKAESLLHLLQIRFGKVPKALEESLRDVQDQRQLDALLADAYHCSSVEEFRARLGEHTR